MTREASCSCGQLRVTVRGESIRGPSICHCLACQRRTGSPFGEQVAFHPSQVEVAGDDTEYVRHADDDGEARRFHFCPRCGATVFYTYGDDPDPVIIPVGAFADPGFAAPVRTVYTDRKHAWLTLPGSIEIFD